MKISKIINAFALTLAISTSAWSQSKNYQTLNIPLSHPGENYTLNVRLIRGSITISGYEGNDLVLERETVKELKGKQKSTLNNTSAISFVDLPIHVEQVNNQVIISEQSGEISNVILRVPKHKVVLKLSMEKKGDIVVDSVEGVLEIANVNGFIQLNSISGSVVASTVNGTIKVIFKTINQKAAMAFSTLRGDVDVTFPKSLNANLKLKSDKGEILSAFKTTDINHQYKTDQSIVVDMYKLPSKDWYYWIAGNGGPDILLKTTFGRIYIRKLR